MVLHYDRRSFWTILMVKCENHYFRIREHYFCGLLDCGFTPMSSLELVKNRGTSWSQQCLQSITCLSFSHNLNNKNKRKQWKEQKTKKWIILDTILHFNSPNHEFSFKFFFMGINQLVFPPKIYHVGYNTILFVLVLDPCLKALGPI
jgi:hypothetical protein